MDAGWRLLRPGHALRQAGGALLSLDPLFLNQFIGDVVLIDVSHIGDRFLADPSGGDDLDVVKPNVRIKPALRRFLPEFLNTGWAAILGGK